jgi:glycosyltransferase involved in cell wall biosynthesis
MATVSVIMASYNWANTIVKAIQSVLSQSYKDFEFIIVDDGSTDNTGSTLKNWEDIDNRIIIIKNNKNLGLTASLNKWIGHSTWEYIARIDDDDSWETPFKLEKQVNFMEINEEYWLVWTNINLVDENWNIYREVKMRETDNEIRKSIMLSNQFAHPSVLIRKSTLDLVWLYDESFKVAQDGELWLRIWKVSKFYNLQFIWLNYTEPLVTSSQKYIKQRLAALRLVWMYAFNYPNTILGFFSRVLGVLLPKQVFQYVVKIWKRVR